MVKSLVLFASLVFVVKAGWYPPRTSTGHQHDDKDYRGTFTYPVIHLEGH